MKKNLPQMEMGIGGQNFIDESRWGGGKQI